MGSYGEHDCYSSPRPLSRQVSCGFIDAAALFGSSRRRGGPGFRRYVPDDDYCSSSADDFGDEGTVTSQRASRAGGAALFVRSLWRKIVRGGSKMRGSPAPPRGPSRFGAAAAPYDACSYAQNFDDGEATWGEPDILCRSFSARYAAPPPSAVTARSAVR